VKLLSDLKTRYRPVDRSRMWCCPIIAIPTSGAEFDVAIAPAMDTRVRPEYILYVSRWRAKKTHGWQPTPQAQRPFVSW
jgi:hypothetical protein